MVNQMYALLCGDIYHTYIKISRVFFNRTCNDWSILLLMSHSHAMIKSYSNSLSLDGTFWTQIHWCKIMEHLKNVNAKENRSGDQEWTIQGYRQHWEHHTERRHTIQQNTTQKTVMITLNRVCTNVLAQDK